VSEVLEGEIQVRRHEDGRITVERAPQRARMSLAVLHDSGMGIDHVGGNTVRLVGGTTYRVVGWDAHQSALLLEREDGAAPAFDRPIPHARV
jgi:hypothetical protein